MTKPLSLATQRSQHDDRDDIDLPALLGTLSDNKWLIAKITVAFFVLGIGYALLARPVYEASAMVQVEPKTPSLPGLADISPTLDGAAPEAATQISIITSRSVIGKAVDDLRLYIQVRPHQFPLIGNFIARHNASAQPSKAATPWFGMSRYGWGGEKLDVQRLDVPAALVGEKLTLIAGVHDSYQLYDDDNNLLLSGKVGQLANGSSVAMQVNTLTANPGMRFEVVRQGRLSAISALQNTGLMGKGIGAIEQTKDSGIISLTYRNGDPDRAVNTLAEVIDYYIQQNVDRNSMEASTSLQFVRAQLTKVQQDLEQAENKLNTYRSQVHSVDISQEAKNTLDQIVAIDTNISSLRLQQADVERKFTPEHPAYQALMKQIGDLEAEKKKLSDQVGALPETQQELLRLERDVQVRTQTYTNLLDQSQKLDIARAGSIGSAHIIDPAAVDTSLLAWPKKVLIIPGSALLGLFCALGWIYIRQMLNRGIEEPAEIEHLGLSVYASIPFSARQREYARVSHSQALVRGRSQLLAIDAPADVAMEAIRSLRTSLHFSMLDASNNRLAISGASPSAGKTFTSTNLAAVMGQAGQRVLLIDGDLRKGDLHRVLGGNAQNGLSEWLDGKIDLDGAIQPTEIDHVHFIARGQVPPNPSELLMRPSLAALLEQASARYDMVIIDTPPILAVTDAAIIGRLVGTNLIVTRFGFNRTKELALAKQRFDQSGIELSGAIFNGIEKRSAGFHNYGYYEYLPDGA